MAALQQGICIMILDSCAEPVVTSCAYRWYGMRFNAQFARSLYTSALLHQQKRIRLNRQRTRRRKRRQTQIKRLRRLKNSLRKRWKRQLQMLKKAKETKINKVRNILREPAFSRFFCIAKRV